MKTKRYNSEWNLFVKFLNKHGNNWGVNVFDVLENRLSRTRLDYLLAVYFSNSYNLKVKKQLDVIVRLDPNTVGPTVSKLCSVIEKLTDYR